MASGNVNSITGMYTYRNRTGQTVYGICLSYRSLHYGRTTAKSNAVGQRFSNFFQVGTTFISQNVIRTTLLLSALKANCLTFSTIVCDTQFTLILFFLSILDLYFNLRGPQGQNPRTTCGPRTTV
jgi:hypothetical protein